MYLNRFCVVFIVLFFYLYWKKYIIFCKLFVGGEKVLGNTCNNYVYGEEMWRVESGEGVRWNRFLD